MLTHSKAFSSFSSNDIAQAKAFYSDTLGVVIKENSMGVLELHIEGSTPIMIYPKTDHVPATFTVLNFPVPDIDAAVETLIEKGIIFEQYDGHISTDAKGISRNNGGPAIAWFKDPGGNILSVIQQ